MPPGLFFLKISLTIRILLCFHTHFRVVLFVRNAIRILVRIALNLYIALDSMGILTILILPVHEHDYLSVYLCLLQFLLSVS